jgi:hypothetical protein
MSENRRPVSGVFIALVVLVVAIVIGALFYYYMPESPPNVMDEIDYEDRQNYTVEGSVTSLRLSMEMDQGQLDISFADLGQYAFTVEISMTGTASTPDPDKILQWSLSQGLDGQNATANFDLNINQTIITSGLKVKCHFIVDPSYIIGLEVVNTAGETNVRGNSTLMLDSADIGSSAGMIRMDLMEGTKLGSDIRVHSQVGSLELNWDNVELEDAPHDISLSTVTGSVLMQVVQETGFTGVVNWTVLTNLGNVQTSFSTIAGISSNITGEVGSGLLNSASVIGYAVNKTENRVEATSLNYPSEQRFEVSLSVNIGNLILIANWVP